MQLTDHPPVSLWLEQFGRDTNDRSLVELMISEFRYVTNIDLKNDITALLLNKIPQDQIAAIYVERELQTTRNRNPVKMYREVKVSKSGSRKKALRAQGAALPVVRSIRNDRQNVGSEEVLANQLTQLCAQNSRRFILQPSAEKVRSLRVRHVVVVTDFIGSGNRIFRMLDSLWRVRSIKSWHSRKLVKFWVFCYSGTNSGILKVNRHKTKPRTELILPCPTLQDSFELDESRKLQKLCITYAPSDKSPLGYAECGALISFEHGCPNNLPAIFIEKSSSLRRPWQPLFENRSATVLTKVENSIKLQEKSVALEALSFPNIIFAPSYLRFSSDRKSVTVLLATLARGHRHINELVSESRMSLGEIIQAQATSAKLGLIDANLRLTPAGFRELQKLNRSTKSNLNIVLPKINYYPSMLRAPLQ